MRTSGGTHRFRDVRGMFGPPQTADISGPRRHFAKVPNADNSQQPSAVAASYVTLYLARNDRISSRKIG